MEQWTLTTDTRFAAAMGTLGVPIRVESVMDTRDNRSRVRFFLGLLSVDGLSKTKLLRRQLRSGVLEDTQPAHPLLNIFRGFENRNMLLDCGNQGARIRLVQVPGTECWQYVESDTGLPGLPKRDAEIIKTGDLKLASALGVVGLAVIHIEGPQGSRQYFLPRYGMQRGGGLGRVDGLKLMQAWRQDKASVPWADPFAQASRGLYTRERLLDIVNRHQPQILMRKPRSNKAAILDPNASDEAFDIVHDFFSA